MPTPPHGGGYDDIAVQNGQVFLTASNPMSDPNSSPALVLATLHGNMVWLDPVLTPIAAGFGSTRGLIFVTPTSEHED